MTNGFGTGTRLFHWLVVLLVLVQIPAGIVMIAPALKQESIDRLFILHKGLGVVLLVVVVARVLWRLAHPAPPMSETFPELERRMATTVHRFSTFLLIALVSVHVGEVLRHHLVLGDETLGRMWPQLGGPELPPDSETKPESRTKTEGVASPEGGAGGVGPS